MAVAGPPRPLSEHDDRERFDCGRPSLNMWFRRHALINHQAGISRVSVIAGTSGNRVAAFVSLSSAQIERMFLPKPQQRNRPNPVPVTLLGQLAVDVDFQGQGIAASLLNFALRTALQASGSIGSMGVITHPLDEGVRSFYAKWGFEDLPFDPGRAMMVRMTDVRKAFT